MFLVTAFCASVALVLWNDVYTIPLPALHYIAIIAMSIFATAGVVTFLGSFSMRLSEAGVIEIDDTTYLGRKMNEIIKFGAKSQTELHCCDIYVASTKATTLACFFVSAGVLITCFAIDTFLAFVLIVCALVGVVAFFVGLAYLSDAYDYRHAKKKADSKSNKKPSPMWEIAKDWGGCIFAVFVVVAIVLSAGFVLVVWPIMELMVLGYTWYAATGFYLLSVSIVTFPAFCIGGKKLVQRLPFADSFCPIVARKH